MRILHYNDEEKQLHSHLSQQGHDNVILAAKIDPFVAIRMPEEPPRNTADGGARDLFDAAFVGLYPHGLKLIQALLRHNGDCLVTIITNNRDTRMAVEAMRRGAFDYLLTPLDFDHVERTTIHMTRQHHQQLRERRLNDRLAEVQSHIASSDPTPHHPGDLAQPAKLSGLPGKLPGGMRGMRRMMEKRLIEQTLTDCRNNVSKTARVLGISRTTLYQKLKDFRLG